MKIQAQFLLLMAIMTLIAGCSTMAEKVAPMTSDSGLVNSLTQKLGVSNEQATGGAGAILSQAKAKLSPEDYAKVNESLPETETLIKAAPKDDGMTGKLGGMASALTGGNEAAGGLGALAGSFGKLGLSPDMVGQFMPIVMDYAKDKGGASVAGLLQGVLQ